MSSSSASPPTERERHTLSLLLRAEERRCSAATLRRIERRGWVSPGAGGAYRLTIAGRALAESLEAAPAAPVRSTAP